MTLPNIISAGRGWIVLYRCQLGPLNTLVPPPFEPLSMRAGRGMVAVFCLDCEDSSLGRYRQFGVGIVARPRSWLAPPFGALWLERKASDVGYWMQFSAVSTPQAVEAMQENWGVSSFLADIDLTTKRSRVVASVREKGAEVLSLEVKRPGADMPLRFPFRWYARKDGHVVQSDMSVDAVGRERAVFASATLSLRRHERAEDLRGMSIEANDPLRVRWYDSFRTRMDEPVAKFKIK